MRGTQWHELVECLESALENGFDEVLVNEPEAIFEDMLNEMDNRWEDVSNEEIYTVIRDWQERQEKA